MRCNLYRYRKQSPAISSEIEHNSLWVLFGEFINRLFKQIFGLFSNTRDGNISDTTIATSCHHLTSHRWHREFFSCDCFLDKFFFLVFGCSHDCQFYCCILGSADHLYRIEDGQIFGPCLIDLNDQIQRHESRFVRR